MEGRADVEEEEEERERILCKLFVILTLTINSDYIYDCWCPWFI